MVENGINWLKEVKLQNTEWLMYVHREELEQKLQREQLILQKCIFQKGK